MIRLTKLGLDHLLSGNALIGSSNIIIVPMRNGWSGHYTNTPALTDYLYLDSSGNPVGYSLNSPVATYDGLETSSSSNLMNLEISGGIDTGSPSATIATTNDNDLRYWMVRDDANGVDIGYVDLGVMQETALRSNIVLALENNYVGSSRVNSGENYIFSDALRSVYSGEVNSLLNPVEIAIIKKTDESDISIDDIIGSTNGQNLTNIAASSTMEVVASGIQVTPSAYVGTESASIVCEDQSLIIAEVSESKCTPVIVLKNSTNSIIKVIETNISIEGYLIINFTDNNNEFVLF